MVYAWYERTSFLKSCETINIAKCWTKRYTIHQNGANGKSIIYVLHRLVNTNEFYPLHDNGRAQVFRMIVEKLHNSHNVILPHPQYSPFLSPTITFLFHFGHLLPMLTFTELSKNDFEDFLRYWSPGVTGIIELASR